VVGRPATQSHPRHRLDPVLHFPIRLSIVAALAEVAEAEFKVIADLVEINAPTMSKQVSTLEQAGYVSIRKGLRGSPSPDLVGAHLYWACALGRAHRGAPRNRATVGPMAGILGASPPRL
jgi:hypothetical protein